MFGIRDDAICKAHLPSTLEEKSAMANAFKVRQNGAVRPTS